MWNIISKISTQNKKSSVIITTHSMEEAEALCGRVAFLKEGRLCAMKSTKDLKLLDGGLKEYFRKINLKQ